MHKLNFYVSEKHEKIRVLLKSMKSVTHVTAGKMETNKYLRSVLQRCLDLSPSENSMETDL